MKAVCLKLIALKRAMGIIAETPDTDVFRQAGSGAVPACATSNFGGAR